MKGNLVISFNATESQTEMMLDFCREKTGSNAIITVCQPLSSQFALGLSIFENRPQIYMGIIDLNNKTVVEKGVLSDEDLQKALKNLEYKYAHVTSRKDPVANAELVLVWIDYINRHIGIEGIPIEEDSTRDERGV